MRRYLVVAHQTLTSPELLDAMKSTADEESTSFHLLVPIYHGDSGLTWTLGHDRAVAQRRLDVARDDLHEKIFAWMTLGDERNLAATYVAGSRVQP